MVTEASLANVWIVTPTGAPRRAPHGCSRSPLFSLLAWRILTLRPCVDAAVNGFGFWGRRGGYRDCRSCGRRGHCDTCWAWWQMHGHDRTVVPAMVVAVHIKMRRFRKF